MQAKMLCLEEGEREKRFEGKVEVVYEASFRDVSEGRRCTNNFVIRLEGDQKDRLKGKLRDNHWQVSVAKITGAFNGDYSIVADIEPWKNGSAAKPN